MRGSIPADDIMSSVHETYRDNTDLEYRTLSGGGRSMTVLYLKSLCDSKKITHSLIAPFFEMGASGSFAGYLWSLPGVTQPFGSEQAVGQVLKGFTVILLEERIYLYEAAYAATSGISDASVESIVQGPADAFNEDIDVNINMVRRRYESERLKVETGSVGRTSRTKIALIYDTQRVDPKILQELKARLGRIDVDLIQSAAQLQKQLNTQSIQLFPELMVTERPDRVVQNLACGRIGVLVNTTGFALILPSVFDDFFTSMDDVYQFRIVGQFLKIIRYIGLFLTLTLPAFYIAFTSYNPEILKDQLTLLIAGSRASVPYPSFVEVLFMLLMMEFLIEASLRLPKAVGPTATTVGGLILGQAATEAGLVGNIMVIIVSAVAISNFVIPITMMNFSIRVLKYGFIFLASIFGLVGIVLGFIALVMYLSNLESFGQPYLRISVKLPWKDVIPLGRK
ncbi:GerA spore germination protein [Paenibacillus mucilaginosus 3016]|uniref:GerA spore germination protein n=1 Tax=Paenibacillus mucilaginosus 3016 TaxID=1116391 RepID=H6NLV5_9BACL|nr:spore germination protein [Paenibacillus mucilaginosus]AFC31670.1 GerA spore germination protein [Paenibacillus mucilaginosus 3016]WFA20202.1 spore germination protein [Paenibacillus mucilaginosus]